MVGRIRAFLGSLGRDLSGVASLEFALVAIPFFTLMFGTMEMGLLLFKGSVVEGATREASRKLRTGEAQTASNPMDLFKTTFCSGLLGLYDCGTFYFDVRNFPDFTSISLPPIQFDSNGNPSNVVFQPGGPGMVVTTRVVHHHAFITPLIAKLVSDGSGGATVMSTGVYKTEPYK